MSERYIVERRMLYDTKELQRFLDTDPYPDHRLLSAQVIEKAEGYVLIWELLGPERYGLLKAVKRAYRKHVLDDPDIGWDQLGEELRAALCNALENEGFCKWLDKFSDDKSASEM